MLKINELQGLTLPSKLKKYSNDILNNKNITITELNSLLSLIKHKLNLLTADYNNRKIIKIKDNSYKIKSKEEIYLDKLSKISSKMSQLHNYFINKHNYIEDIKKREETILDNCLYERNTKKKSLLILQKELISYCKKERVNVKFKHKKDANLDNTLNDSFFLETLNNNFKDDLKSTTDN